MGLRPLLGSLLAAGILLSASPPGASAAPTPTPTPTPSPWPWPGRIWIPPRIWVPPAPRETITATAGEPFTILLDTTTGTGYLWEIAGALDTAHLELLSSDIIPAQPGVPGATATQRFRFMPVTSGETTLTLAYVRPADHAGPVRSAAYRVVIVPSAQSGVPQR